MRPVTAEVDSEYRLGDRTIDNGASCHVKAGKVCRVKFDSENYFIYDQ